MTPERVESLVAEVVQRWRTSGISVGEPVGEDEILAFEEKWGARLPEDVVALFRVGNGMEEGHWDEHEIRFWPLAELRPVVDALPDADASAHAGYFLFADFMIWSHEYAVRLSPDGRSDVVLVGGDSPTEVASSFAQFLALYIEAPGALFPAN